MAKKKKIESSHAFKEHLAKAVQTESIKCEKCYLWLEEHMPPSFFEEVKEDDILLIAHSLMGFDLQEFFAHIHLKHSAIVLCLDSDDADLRILKHYQNHGVKNYRAFVSNEAPPFTRIKKNLRIAIIHFTMAPEVEEPAEVLDAATQKKIKGLVKERNVEITDEEFKRLIRGMSPRFLKAMGQERLIMALDMFFRAQSRDHCQYEVIYDENWKKTDAPSMRIVFAWRNVPKHRFLFNLAKVIHRHGLSLQKVNAAYIDPYGTGSTLIMSIGVHGMKGKAAWEECDVTDFLQELVTLKYFEGQEIFEKKFVDTGLVRGNIGNLIKSISQFIHQTLTHADPNMYSLGHVEEGLCRHPELTIMLTEAFEYKFHPANHDLKKYEKTRKKFLELVSDLDTGNEINDVRRKNILYQGMNFVQHTLKNTFYRNNKTAFAFRLDPLYLEYLPYDRTEKFPELPYAIFFIAGMYYIGFHIRFKDLSRGGLRTVFPKSLEQMFWERNNVFAECYNLAYTQQKKNKDIPEGGAKGVIFLEPFERIQSEIDIFRDELREAEMPKEEIQQNIAEYKKAQKLDFLHSSQRSFVEAFITLLNCEPDGTLRAKHIVDYWKKPEYIYLGPDENMHNEMIEWIASHAKYYNYAPGDSFISSKPSAGINHKEYGVTSYGVNVYMEEVLKFMGIDPKVDPFTIKISGGPDGDVAGNQIFNLYRFYPKTAKLLAITDVSGTIYDPEGLDLNSLVELFKKEQPIHYYPTEKLHEEGFHLDLWTKKEESAYAQSTLLYRKKSNKIVKEWLSGNEMNHLFRSNVHQAITDIFIPCGGRPRTLNENNWQDFLDETGKPTSPAIVEGANLYLTPKARIALEKKGVLIIKDSSANKGGVITSSYEVLTSLVLSTEEFIKHKPDLMPEILDLIRTRAYDEATLMLNTHAETHRALTELSEIISARINTYMYQILEHLETIKLSNDPRDPLIKCLLNYCPDLLRKKYQDKVIHDIPDIHKKAIIAVYIAAKAVYTRGIDWSPTIVDILPLISTDPDIV